MTREIPVQIDSSGGGPPPTVPPQIPLTVLVQDIDRGIIRVVCVLEIQLANTLHLTSVPCQHIPGGTVYSAPIVLSYSETSIGFEMGSNSDNVASLDVTASNGRMPIFVNAPAPLPASVIFGRLSDYLTQITRAGSDDFAPGLASLYYTIDNATLDTPDQRLHVFRGLLEDFEVQDDGRVVTMRFIEDLRWDRGVPYVLDKKKFKELPVESAGLTFPICYGNHGLWEHKDFAPSALLSPFTATKGFFPKSLDFSPTVPVRIAPAGAPTVAYSSNLIHQHNIGDAYTAFRPVVLHEYRAGVIVGDGVPTMINPDGASLNGMTLLSLPPDNLAGMADLQRYFQLAPQLDWEATAVLVPVKATNETNNQGGAQTIDTVFAVSHRGFIVNIIDGDRWTFFKDDQNGTGLRRIIWELGQERNLGAIISIHGVIFWRRRVGASNITFTVKVDWGSAAGNSVTGAGNIAAAGPGGYGFNSFDLSALLTAATQTERWDFTQTQPASPRGRGMLVTFDWGKVAGADIIDIYQLGLMVRFNPSRYFIENKVNTQTTYIKSVDEFYANDRKVVVDQVTYRDRVMGVQKPSLSRTGYVGFGMGGNTDVLGDDLWVGADPTYDNAIQNPSEVLRHAMFTYGGGARSDNPPGWPPIKYADFEMGSGPRSFFTAKIALDTAVREATNASTETFKIRVGIASYRSVKELVRLVLGAVPNLQFLALPRSSTADSGFARPSFGLIFPKTGAAPNFRRTVNLHSDMSEITFGLTPMREVRNDWKIGYGYSSSVGNYMRVMIAKGGDVSAPGLMEHGWPVMTTNGGSFETDATDAIQNTIKLMLDSSYTFFGPKSGKIELPFIYRWQEALAIRNSLVRWFAFPRVRLLFTARIDIADIQPGDVFALDGDPAVPRQGDSDDYMDCEFPLLQLPDVSASWNAKTFLVERVTYAPADDGALAMRVQAIFNGKIGEV